MANSGELEHFIQEAHKVRALRDNEGWQILRRDMDSLIYEANKCWMFLDEKDKRYKDLKLKILGCRMLIEMVEDYEVNRLQAEREWLKAMFPDLYVEADVDNETPLNEKEGN